MRLYCILRCRGLTEDSSHRQDEQLQQCVLFLIGQTQEAQLGHFDEVGNSLPTTYREIQQHHGTTHLLNNTEVFRLLTSGGLFIMYHW